MKINGKHWCLAFVLSLVPSSEALTQYASAARTAYHPPPTVEGRRNSQLLECENVKRAWIGGVTGFIIGAIAGHVHADSDKDLAALIGGMIGSGIGAIIAGRCTRPSEMSATGVALFPPLTPSYPRRVPSEHTSQSFTVTGDTAFVSGTRAAYAFTGPR